MSYQALNIRTFIGARDFEESREFYRELGFTEFSISNEMSLFKLNDSLGFYLQKYYVKKWVQNSMVFVEVDDVDQCYDSLEKKAMHQKYKYARLTPIKKFAWGRECFLHDPSGVLWHFCQFNEHNDQVG